MVELADIRPSDHVLDIGTGTGVVALRAARKIDDAGMVCGIDLSENMLNRAAKTLGEKVQLVLGDADNLPWQENTFDLLICNSSFHHYPEPLKVLMEMRRVLKADGRLVIADPWWSNAQRRLINLYLKSPFNLKGDVRIYSKQEFIMLLSECGFQQIEWEKPSNKYCIASAVAGK